MPTPRLPGAPPSDTSRFTLDVDDDGAIGVTVVGDLDPVAARTLVELVETAIDVEGTSRQVEIDLRRVRACSNSGVRALATCAELGARLRDGLQFRLGVTPDLSGYPRDGMGTLEQ
jgi:hypothetical protein